MTKSHHPFMQLLGRLVLVFGVSLVLAADASDLHDITDIESVPPPSGFHWSRQVLTRVGVGLLVLAGSAGLGWVYWRRLNRRPPPLRAEDWALRELEALAAQDLAAAGMSERSHTMLSDIVRRYLELRFGFAAPEQTTAEILQGVGQSADLPDDRRAVLRHLLETCDVAKFAGIAGSETECRRLIEEARQFVRDTSIRAGARALSSAQAATTAEAGQECPASTAAESERAG